MARAGEVNGGTDLLFTREERIQALYDALQQRILVLDGAMGTALQARGLTSDDFGGPEFEGCNEYLVITRPDVVLDIHRGYLEAGADIVETNSFGSSALVLAEYPPLHEQAYTITRRAAELARQAADEYSRPGRPRWVAGSMGPTTKAISVTGGVTFEQLVDTFREQARALVDGGVDYLLLETCQDTRNIKAGLIGIWQLFEETGVRVPIAVSGTIEPTGTMLAGQTIEALITSLEHADLLYIGLNCATGPEFMTDHIRAAAELARVPVACVPNAGLPDEEGRYLETPEMMAKTLSRFLDEGWLNLIGGCCGTTADHIRALVRIAEGRTPRKPPQFQRTFVSGIENLEISEETRPIIVGERTNVIGSRRFKRLIQAGQFEEASEIARRQVKGGAHIIDICLADPDRDELADMERFLAHVIHKVKVPLMIDSTDPVVIERALTYCQGKAIINSINLEDGEERFARVVPLARRFGAALVVGTIDDDPKQGMAVTRERKLQVAQRAYELLTRKYDVPPTDIIFDPLVFPCATGDGAYAGSAIETIEGIRLIKKAFPLCKTILGISNVSFGLPPAGREVLNAVFLYHCVQAGLDMAIVNSEQLMRYSAIPEEERRLAEAVLFETSDEAIAAFTAYFRGAVRRPQADTKQLSVEERLAQYIIEGSKDGLIEDLNRKLAEGASPLDIINGPLMAGMDEVGRLFNRNEMIVAEVLQSAEVMKAAVSYLEQFMEKADAAVKGTVLLATVKGDVHDIGKNLVHIVLSNNGYRVINLGIKVPPGDLIKAIKEYKPDIVGLSGLLVKSAQQMVVTAEELTAAGVCPDMLVGGAALTKSFTRRKIAPVYNGLVLYAKDAMHGLELANQLIDPERRQALLEGVAREDEELHRREELRRQQEELRYQREELRHQRDPRHATEQRAEQRASEALQQEDEFQRAEKVQREGELHHQEDGVHTVVGTPVATRSRNGVADALELACGGQRLVRSPAVPILKPEEIPQPPDFDRHVLRNIDLDTVWAFINPAMLYTRHLGLKGKFEELLARGDEKALMLKDLIDGLKAECRRGLMQVHAVWQFFPAMSRGNTLYLLEPPVRQEPSPRRRILAAFSFPRQQDGDRLCLADYVRPADADCGEQHSTGANGRAEKPHGMKQDNVCLFAVTAGIGIRELYQRYRDRGDYLLSHAIQALAIETAEAAAEWLHSVIRGQWGFPDDPTMTMKERFQARYRGRRYSFGYPACPDLSLQKTLFEVLRPEEIGIELTDGFMMEPEASVSALVLHHPSCKYFDVT